MAGDEEQFQPFTCRNAIYHLCKKSRKSKATIEESLSPWLDDSLVSLCENKLFVVYELLQYCQVPVCIIGQKKNKHKYLMDVRHLYTKTKPLFWIIDVDTGVFLKETTRKDKVPKLTYHNQKYKGLNASLWDILQIPGDEEPQSAQEMIELLEKHQLLTQTNIFYCISLVPQQEMPWVMGHLDSPCPPICFFAYTKADLSIGYAFKQPKQIDALPLCNQNIENTELDPDSSTANRKCAVSVKLTGLLLAYSLGVCMQSEMAFLSTALSYCVGAIWITCDERKHVRHVLYKDAKCCKSVEIFCEESNEQAWTSLLKVVKQRAEAMKEEKAGLLAPLMARLESFTKFNTASTWSTCLSQLKNAIKKHKVFVFCNDDTALHQLKVPVAGVFQTPKSKGVYIKSMANHTITALCTPTVLFINLAEYFNYRGRIYQPYIDDDTLWEIALDWLPHDGRDSFSAWSNPELEHGIKQMKHHEKMFEVTRSTYVKQRSERNADLILQLWTALVQYLMGNFNYDLSTKPHISLSKMSFEIVWLMYSKQAGPLAHGLENLHPYTVFKLRPWCKGGFSYSFENYLEVGQPLFPGAEQAKSIREYDLTSAYGYSGMTMSAAKGFGIAFSLDTNVKTQRRYKLFEYRAVMYTIYKLLYTEKKKIKTVFSNYSPLGLLYIGKHPLDLAVVLEDNTLKLYQFDGHFCHGDYNRPHCPTLDRYANNKTRQECERQTKQRDETILNWLIKTDIVGSTYEVFTDCCHPDYSKENLDKVFFMFRPLFNLIKGLDQLNGTLAKADLEDVTFIAIVEGTTTTNNGHVFGPTFDPPGKMLLTSDYYRYLKYYFGFQITHIEWIIFYRVCKDIPYVFNTLVTMRKNASLKSPKAAFLKSIVNYACGYFGLNLSKQAHTVSRIAYRLPKRFNIFRDEVAELDTFNDQPMLLITRRFDRNANTKYNCNTPLILFVQIIEFGKLRLNQVIQCLQQHVRPKAINILYSNVDNLIIALSEDNLFDALDFSPGVVKAQRDFYLKWRTLCGEGPGMLKEEWCQKSTDNWQFVSPCRMFHVILTRQEHENHHKSTFFHGLPTQEAFQVAMAVLKKQSIQVLQEKKTNKLSGTDTRMVTYTFN